MNRHSQFCLSTFLPIKINNNRKNMKFLFRLLFMTKWNLWWRTAMVYHDGGRNFLKHFSYDFLEYKLLSLIHFTSSFQKYELFMHSNISARNKKQQQKLLKLFSQQNTMFRSGVHKIRMTMCLFFFAINSIELNST